MNPGDSYREDFAVVIEVYSGDEEGEAYHGPSTRAILEGITAEVAAARPLAGAHSIWEIVQQVLAWRELVSRLDENQTRLLAASRSVDDAQLDHARGWLRFLIHHELSHADAGQIAVLRKA